MKRSTTSPVRRRVGATAALAGLALSGTAVFAVLSPAASAAVLGTVDLNHTSGTDATLFDGSVTSAACPVGTVDSYFSIDGPDLPADQAILGTGNATGTGNQSFAGASIANIRSANSGSFSASGIYTVKFNCFSSAGGGSVTDVYQRKLSYTFGGSGAWSYLAATATATTVAASPTTAYVGQTVTLTATVTPSGAAGTVQFKDGVTNIGAPVAVASGTAQTTTAALTEGAHSLTAVFTSSDTDAYGSSTSAAKSYAINGAPTWRPVLYPAPKVGAASLCLASFANVPSSTTFVWYLNGIAIANATASSYTVPETSYAKKLSCKVTATNPAGAVNATSAESVVGVGRALVATTKPYIYGTVKAGAKVYAKPGVWSPAATSYLYAWYVGTTRVSTASSYVIPTAYKGKVLSLLVTARRVGWTNGSYKTAGKVIA